MHSLLMMTSLMFAVSSTADELPSRREIALHVAIIGVDAAVDVPDEVDAPSEFMATLRGNHSVKWSEDFRLYTVENTTAKCVSGSTVPVVSGYTVSSAGRRPFDASGQVAPGGRGTPVSPTTQENARGAVPNRSPILRSEQIGTLLANDGHPDSDDRTTRRLRVA